MISRIRGENSNKTISIGTQITTAKITKNDNETTNKYEEKFEQIKNITPFLHTKATRAEMEQKYGRLTVPDIISYTAINGKIAKKLWANSQIGAKYFEKWKQKNYENSGLLELVEHDIARELHAEKQAEFGHKYHEKPKSARERKAQKAFFESQNYSATTPETITLFAKILDETNNFLLSKDFLDSLQENWKQSENFAKNFTKTLEYNAETKELTLEVFHHDEIVVRSVYFLMNEDIELLKNLQK